MIMYVGMKLRFSKKAAKFGEFFQFINVKYLSKI